MAVIIAIIAQRDEDDEEDATGENAADEAHDEQHGSDHVKPHCSSEYPRPFVRKRSGRTPLNRYVKRGRPEPCPAAMTTRRSATTPSSATARAPPWSPAPRRSSGAVCLALTPAARSPPSLTGSGAGPARSPRSRSGTGVHPALPRGLARARDRHARARRGVANPRPVPDQRRASGRGAAHPARRSKAGAEPSSSTCGWPRALTTARCARGSAGLACTCTAPLAATTPC